METTQTDYVQPNKAGLQSEPVAVGRRIAKLLDALALHTNRYIMSGQIEKDCWQFKVDLIHKLEESGWCVRLGARDQFIVRPPKDKEF